MLRCSFSLAAAQLLVKMTSALQRSQCCSAVSAAQHSKNCSATSFVACGMLQGWGLEGCGLGFTEYAPLRNAADRFRKWANSRVTNDNHIPSRCAVSGAEKQPSFPAILCSSACARLLVHVSCSLNFGIFRVLNTIAAKIITKQSFQKECFEASNFVIITKTLFI